jgi:hypothetical protein
MRSLDYLHYGSGSWVELNDHSTCRPKCALTNLPSLIQLMLTRPRRLEWRSTVTFHNTDNGLKRVICQAWNPLRHTLRELSWSELRFGGIRSNSQWIWQDQESGKIHMNLINEGARFWSWFGWKGVIAVQDSWTLRCFQICRGLCSLLWEGEKEGIERGKEKRATLRIRARYYGGN